MNISNSKIRAKARATLGGGIFENNWLMALVVVLLVEAISVAVAYIPLASLIIAGPLSFGCALVFLKLVRTGEKVKIEDTFEGFKNFSDNLILSLLSTLFIFLWTLLFIIPGIVKSYAYSMCFYIKNDHPEYDWKKCLDESQKMMDGNKWRLFCLDLSFIGWMIVGALCFGVGTLWVSAYMTTSRAIFYNELKGSDSVSESTENATDIG